MLKLSKDWELALSQEFKKEYFKILFEFLDKEYETTLIYPKKDEIFTAFKLTALSEVKLVILGQDPYHNENQAHGLSFSVREGVKIPPSLLNIYKELQSDLGTFIPDNGCLKAWANQGVFLLNTILSVRAGVAFSHKNIGWEQFSDEVIKILNAQDRPIVFLLWGKQAIKKAELLNNKKHLILKAAHPSPLSAYKGFFSCKHFSKTNKFLIENNIKAIDWQIQNLKGR